MRENTVILVAVEILKLVSIVAIYSENRELPVLFINVFIFKKIGEVSDKSNIFHIFSTNIT